MTLTSVCASFDCTRITSESLNTALHSISTVTVERAAKCAQSDCIKSRLQIGIARLLIHGCDRIECLQFTGKLYERLLGICCGLWSRQKSVVAVKGECSPGSDENTTYLIHFPDLEKAPQRLLEWKEHDRRIARREKKLADRRQSSNHRRRLLWTLKVGRG